MEANTEVTPPRSPVPEVTPRQAQVTEPRLAEVTPHPQEVTGPQVEVTGLRVTVTVTQCPVSRQFNNIITLCHQVAVPGPPSTCISRSRSRWTLVALSPPSSPSGPSPSSCLSASSHSELFSPPPPSWRQPDGRMLYFVNMFYLHIFYQFRKRRSASEYGNMTSVEKQEVLIQNYMDTLTQMPELNIQKDMVAKYLECGAEPSLKKDSPPLHGCLQKLSCVLYDKSVKISDGEKEIANM